MPLSNPYNRLYTRRAQVIGTTSAGLDIDGLSDIGEAIADADLLIIDNGGDGGDNVKFAASRIPTYVFSGVSGDIAIASNGAATIQANSVALSTDTTGNYVATIAGTSNEVTVSGSGSEGAGVTIGLPDDVTITGDLTVSGTTTTIESTTVTIDDPLFALADNNSGDAVDIGWYGKYVDSGTKYSGLIRDASDTDMWKLFATTGNSHEAPSTTINTTSGFTLANLSVNELTGTIATAAQTNITSLGTLTGLTLDGDKSVTPGDGAMIHVDTSTITDSNTSGSGTATKYTHITLEAPTLAATNSSVTTSDVATLYINAAATAGTNQTITRNWAMWVDTGNARFDGSIYSGTTEALSSAGLVTVANQSNITGVGTITSGVWQGTDVGVAHGGTGASTATAGFDALSPMTAEGDVLYGGTSGTITKLAKGSDGEFLKLASGVPTWGTVSAGTATGLDTTSASANLPVAKITNTHADATAGYLQFIKDPGSGQGADADILGTITFYGTDASNNAPEELARMESSIVEADHGSEAGAIKFYVAENDATMTAGLQILGQATDDGEIDVTIGAGAASTTTIAGTLTMGSTAAMTTAGLLSVANQSGITGLGTVATGTWEATDVGVAHGGTGVSTLLTNAILTGNGTSAIQAETDLLFSSNKLIPTASAHNAVGTALTMSSGATTAGTTNNIAGGALTLQGGQGKGSGAGGAIIFQTANAGGSGSSLNALATALTINQDLSITTGGTIELGHASDTTLTRSGSGDVTIEGNAIYRAGGTDVPVADGGTGASSLTDNAVLTGSGTSAITAESTLAFTGDILSASSTSADLPMIELTNTHTGATAGKIRFSKDSGSGDDNDVMGTIEFFGTDAAENTHERLAYIDSYIIDSAHGSEAAGLRFYVAENDATNTLGLQILGQPDDNGEVDVTIGAGAASTTTIAGTLTMGSTAAMTNAGLVSVANQSNITGVGTITSGVWNGTAITSSYINASQTGITAIGTIATGTWEATDVGVAHGGTGVSTLLANAVLTGNGTSAIQAESTLLFSSSKLIPTASAHDAAGTVLTMSAGTTTAGTTNNIAGGALTFQGGQGKGSGAGGDIIFQTANAAGSGSSLNALATALTISDDLGSTFTGALTVGVNDTGHDVKLFGASAGAYMLYDQSEDQLVIMGASADATTSTGKLLLATSLTDINANDVIGKVEFQAPHEAGGTDAITVAAGIEAVAQGTFSGSVNATDILFKTGHTEAATEKFRFTSQGEIGVGGANYGTDGQVLTSGGAGAAPAWEDAGGGASAGQALAFALIFGGR